MTWSTNSDPNGFSKCVGGGGGVDGEDGGEKNREKPEQRNTPACANSRYDDDERRTRKITTRVPAKMSRVDETRRRGVSSARACPTALYLFTLRFSFPSNKRRDVRLATGRESGANARHRNHDDTNHGDHQTVVFNLSVTPCDPASARGPQIEPPYVGRRRV